MESRISSLCESIIIALLVSFTGCSNDGDGSTDTDVDTDADTDTDTDTDPQECVRYVDLTSQAKSPDGMGWDTAFETIQDGLDSAFDWVVDNNGEDADLENPYTGPPCEVWVVAGTYYLYESSINDTLALRPNVHLYGGFEGAEELLEERDPVANETIIDGHEGAEEANTVCHVVTGNGQAIIDGFTITGGDAGQPSCDENTGGGMYNTYNDEFTVAHDRWVNNCVFDGNNAYQGGGMYNRHRLTEIEGCTFRGNTSHTSGGGLYIDSGYPTVLNCVFENNEAGTVNWGAGGGMLITNAQSSVPVVENCLFVSNVGGGIFNCEASPEITNCTFTGHAGSAMRNEWYSNSIVTNCLFWGNGSSIFNPTPESESIPVVTYSNVEGGYSGAGNIDQDPLFMNPKKGDFRLQEGSPCIDAANGNVAPEFDIDHNPRVDDPKTKDTGAGSITYADIGCYEHQL